jgi:Leucine-rich repeat (LRR) protein
LAPALLSLDLSHNRLSEIDNSAFKRLSRLQELKLSHNQVLMT